MPSTPRLAAPPRTILAGSNVWNRPNGIAVADGLLEVSSTNVGARLFAADIQRASIAGGLVGSRLPFAGLLRYENAVYFFLGENTSAQVYLNETAVSGLTTSATAGRLRVAVPDGGGGYDVFDAGFSKPPLLGSDVSLSGAFGLKQMVGSCGVAISRWRSKTEAWGPPSDVVYEECNDSNDLFSVTLPAAVAGQDGWILAGTRWGDQSGEIRVIRYIYTFPRGTFTATNGSPNLTSPAGTFWNRDIYRNDTVEIDGANYVINGVSETQLAMLTNFTGVTGPGKTMEIIGAGAEWYNSELGDLIDRDVLPPPRAAGVLQYGGRVFLWGCRGEDDAGPTGPVVFPTIDKNPEHIGLTPIVTQSGSNIVNALGGDGPMYLMTTTSLESVSYTANLERPFIVRIIAEPGFKAATNGALYKDYFYGFNNRPLRTRADDNIDVQFARPVWSDMVGWNAERVIVAVDPENEAVLYIYDNGSTTVVIPYMAQMGVWSPPINLTARILDTQVVNGVLYVTYLSGGNIRVNQWEGGSGIGGTRYAAGQYNDTNMLMRHRIKNIGVVGKGGTLRVYAATPGAAVPDVTDTAQAAASFTLSDTDIVEPEISTNIHAKAAAFRVDFASNDGRLEKLVARGMPMSERR